MLKISYLLTLLTSLFLSNPIISQNIIITSQPTGVGSSTGVNNTVLGLDAGTAGTSNVFVGSEAGYSNTTGFESVFIGAKADYRNTTGRHNVFIGQGSGYGNTTSFGNVFTGVATGTANTTGGSNVFTGFFAGFKNTTGNINVFIGANAGRDNTTGGSNVFIGTSAGLSNTAATGNTAIGNAALLSNQISEHNTVVGYEAGMNTVAGFNTFMGWGAGRSVNTGSSNTYFGDSAGAGNTTGSRNTFVGQARSTNANDNVYIGYRTGLLDQGSRNTFLGAEAGVLLAKDIQPLENATAIGYGAQVGISNALVLGKGVNVGIGTSTPTSKLDIIADTLNQSGLRLRQLTTKSPASQYSDSFLSVNEKGEVVKAYYRARLSNVTDWSDRVFEDSYQLRSLAELEHYIKVHKHLPEVPSAEVVVQEGIDVAQMNAKLLQKIEELTLYVIDLKKEVIELRQRDQQRIAKVQHKAVYIGHASIDRKGKKLLR